jgi:copper chaperone
MLESVLLSVNGMKCGGCEANVNKVLTTIAGVSAVKADHKANQVSIEFDDASTSLADIKDAITKAGYEVEPS